MPQHKATHNTTRQKEGSTKTREEKIGQDTRDTQASPVDPSPNNQHLESQWLSIAGATLPMASR